MAFPTDTFLQFFRNSSNYVAQEFENFYAQLEGYLRKEHKDDGSHGSITVDAITVRPDGTIVFTLTGGTERGRIGISGGQLSVIGVPLYMLGKAVVSDQLTITASGTTAGVDAGDVTLLGSNARVYEAAYAAGMGHWTDYTPTWAASGTAPSNGTFTEGRYTRVGDTVIGQFRMDMGGSTTFGTGQYSWTLPVTADYSAVGAIGSAHLFDSGTAHYVGTVMMTSSTTAQIYADNTANYVGQLVPFTWVSGDFLSVQFSYPAA